MKAELNEDPKDARYGNLRVDDGAGGFLTGEVATGPLIADRFKHPWPEHPRDILLRSLTAPTAWLFKLQVPKGSRGRGRGTELLRTAIEILRQRGVRYITMVPRPETLDDRERLWRFYQGFGFERRGDYMVLDLQG